MSELYVEVNGNGPDLVLLHGWGLNVRVWDGLVAELRDRFRLIAVDLPGHGKSPWTPGRNTPAEQAWLLHSTLAPISNRYSLLGWSLGGQIALDLAAAMPAQIDRLVLVATTPRFTAAPDWPYGMKLEAITKMATQLREDYQRTVRDFLDLQVRGSMDGPSVVEQLRQALAIHGEAAPEALAAGLNTLATSDLRSTLPHVRTPTLVIAGQNDRITAPGASRVLATTLPDARYVEMRRAAHAPFLSHRKEFIGVLEQFLLSGELDFGGAPGSADGGKSTGDAAVPSASHAAAAQAAPAAHPTPAAHPALAVHAHAHGPTPAAGAAAAAHPRAPVAVSAAKAAASTPSAAGASTATARVAAVGTPTAGTPTASVPTAAPAPIADTGKPKGHHPAQQPAAAAASNAARPAKKKRMKARARKKLQTSHR